MPINTDYPAPQADRLDKVAVVIDAVDAGAATASAIAHALGVVERQGAYYANAAAYLGLIDQLDTIPVSYRLTSAGTHMLEADTDTRAALLAELVLDVPAVQLVLADTLDDVEAHYRSLGLEENTASRRAATARVWARTAQAGIDPASLHHDATLARATALATAAVVKRTRAAVTPAAVCTTCFTQLPSTGQCDNCA